MVAERLKAILDRVADAALNSGRDAGDVTVVAVSKGQPLERVREVYAAGHRDFGENRAQELVERAAVLPPDIRWHMVGHLQRNKIKTVRPLIVMLHSLDALRTARGWVAEPKAPPALVEVNLAAEPQKHGIAPAQTAELVTGAIELGLQVRGLMALPPAEPDLEAAGRWFRRLAELRDEIARPELVELSMGMSGDFEVAIAEGATMVRIGEAIFGPRDR